MIDKLASQDAEYIIEETTKMVVELRGWEKLRVAAAKTIGEDPQTWPDHGNAPVAISAALALRQMSINTIAQNLPTDANPDGSYTISAQAMNSIRKILEKIQT